MERERRSRRSGRLVLFVLVSLALHAAVALYGSDLLAGLVPGASDPEERPPSELLFGPGGSTVPLAIEGAPSEAPLAPPADPPSTPPPEPDPIAEPRPRPPHPHDVGGEREGEAAETEASGTGAEQTEGGGQGEGEAYGSPEGTVVEAAPPAPPPDRCGDPVIGVWQGQRFDGGEWVRMTLRIQRSGDDLTGSIESRIWRGQRDRPRPGPCTAFGEDRTWRMTASGTASGRSISFAGGRARLIREDCPAGAFDYAPDRFTGTVVEAGDVMHAVNNDGRYAINEGYTLRRSACH